MESSNKTLEFRFERTIPAPLPEVFDGWLDPKIPDNPWNAAEKFLLDPKVDGLFFWTLNGRSHYGRFIVVERPARISTYVGVAEDAGTRVDSDRDLQEKRKRHPDDPRPFRPSGS